MTCRIASRKDENFAEIRQQLANKFDEFYVGLVDTKTAVFYDGIEDILLKLPSAHNDEKERVKIAALTNACVDYAHVVLKTKNYPIKQRKRRERRRDILNIHFNSWCRYCQKTKALSRWLISMM